MKRVEFEGGWIDVREPHEVTNAGRRAVRSTMSAAAKPLTEFTNAKDDYITRLGLDGEPSDEQLAAANGHATVTVDFDEATWDRMQQLFDASLVAAIAGWSLAPLPVSRESLNSMPVDQYDVIAAAGRPYAEAISKNLSVDFSLQTTDPNTPDPTGA